MTLLIILLSLFFGVERAFGIHGHHLSWAGTFEAFSHIWVGFLLALWIFRKDHRRASWIALVAITVIETVMFFVQK
jgi:hypothetical protein